MLLFSLSLSFISILRSLSLDVVSVAKVGLSSFSPSSSVVWSFFFSPATFFGLLSYFSSSFVHSSRSLSRAIAFSLCPTPNIYCAQHTHTQTCTDAFSRPSLHCISHFIVLLFSHLLPLCPLLTSDIRFHHLWSKTIRMGALATPFPPMPIGPVNLLLAHLSPPVASSLVAFQHVQHAHACHDHF